MKFAPQLVAMGLIDPDLSGVEETVLWASKDGRRARGYLTHRNLLGYAVCEFGLINEGGFSGGISWVAKAHRYSTLEDAEEIAYRDLAEIIRSMGLLGEEAA